MWPVPESQTVYDGMARRIQPGPLALRAIGDSLPSSTSSPTYHAAPRATRKPTRAVHRYKLDNIFSARGTPVLRFRPGNDKPNPRVTRLVSVAFSVAFPCGVSPARRRGRGHIVNSSWRLPPSRDPRPDPHQALAWAPLSTTATPIFYVQPLACRCASHVCSSARAACWRASSTLAATLG